MVGNDIHIVCLKVETENLHKRNLKRTCIIGFVFGTFSSTLTDDMRSGASEEAYVVSSSHSEYQTSFTLSTPKKSNFNHVFPTHIF